MTSRQSHVKDLHWRKNANISMCQLITSKGMPPADEARSRGPQLTGCGLNPLLCLAPSACEKLGEYGRRRGCGTGRSGRTGNSSSHSHASRYASRSSGHSGRPTGAHRPYPTASGSRRPVLRLASWPSSRPSHKAVSKPSHSSNYNNYSLTASPKPTAAISPWYVPEPSSTSIVRNSPNSVPAITKNQEPGNSTSTKSHGRDRCDKTCTGPGKLLVDHGPPGSWILVRRKKGSRTQGEEFTKLT